MNKTLVIIPTFNERENIESIVGRVLAAIAETDVLIVDDNSPDGTGAIASNLALADRRVSVLHREVKDGLGGAYRSGFAWGLDRGYHQLVEMDADGSHQPEELPLLLDQLGAADVVLGSRWVSGGTVKNWPFGRALLSRGGSMYARMALGIPVRDLTSGFRAFTAAALHSIRMDRVASQGYCFQIDVLLHAHAAGLRIAEVPITFIERVFGESKMSSRIVIEAMLRVTGWGIRGLPERLRNAVAVPAHMVEPAAR